MTDDDRARLTALGLIDAARRNDRDALTRTLTDLHNDPDQHLQVTTTLTSIAAGLITGMHAVGVGDLADRLLQTWINPDPNDTP